MSVDHTPASPSPNPGVDDARPSDIQVSDIQVGDIQVGDIHFNSEGLVPAIVQSVSDDAVLMMAWMNRDTLARTLAEGRTVFWSRSRNEEWAKGETSGDRQIVQEVWYDCDGDTLLIKVDQQGGGACHTGRYSCFYRRLDEENGTDETGETA